MQWTASTRADHSITGSNFKCLSGKGSPMVQIYNSSVHIRILDCERARVLRCGRWLAQQWSRWQTSLLGPRRNTWRSCLATLETSKKSKSIPKSKLLSYCIYLSKPWCTCCPSGQTLPMKHIGCTPSTVSTAKYTETLVGKSIKDHYLLRTPWFSVLHNYN